MIHSREGYPIPTPMLDSNRRVMGYYLEDMSKVVSSEIPVIDRNRNNLDRVEALTPNGAEICIVDINSKYGVFLLKNSELSISPVLATDRDEVAQ